MTSPGAAVAELLGSTRRDAMVIAPFMRSAALARLLDAVPEGVSTTVVTRWRPLDILAGASDLATFDVTEARNIRLLLRHDLHAKLFIADERCLVGSANVTATALGWRDPSNLELLAPVGRRTAEIQIFEATLLADPIPATAAERDRMTDLVGRLQDRLGTPWQLPSRAVDDTSLIPMTWVPQVANPEDLYAVYRGDLETVSRAARPTMLNELTLIGLAPGMTKNEFHVRVANAIAQAPVVKEVLTVIDRTGSVTEAEFAGILRRLAADMPAGSVADSLIVLQRWLSHFMPENYETVQESIRLIQANRV